MAAMVEQETTITIGRDEEVVRVYSSHLPHLRRLRKLANDDSKQGFVREVAGGDDWGQFEVNAASFHMFSAIRRKRVMSEEQRLAAAERLAAVR